MEALKDNPFELFNKWYGQWKDTGFPEPDAATLSTVDQSGQPSSRIILMRSFDERGFTFFTNYTSRKGHELSHNPKAALNFYWEQIDKQVQIEGTVEKTSSMESDMYFGTRPRGSQLAAWASKQSHVVKHPEELAKRLKEITEQYKDENMIPRPPFWGGYRVVPHRIEFWQRGEHRLHTRLCYRNINGKWEAELLYP